MGGVRPLSPRVGGDGSLGENDRRPVVKMLWRGSPAVIEQHEVFARSGPEPPLKLERAVGIRARLAWLSQNRALPVRASRNGVFPRFSVERGTSIHVVVGVHGKKFKAPSFNMAQITNRGRPVVEPETNPRPGGRRIRFASTPPRLGTWLKDQRGPAGRTRDASPDREGRDENLGKSKIKGAGGSVGLATRCEAFCSSVLGENQVASSRGVGRGRRGKPTCEYRESGDGSCVQNTCPKSALPWARPTKQKNPGRRDRLNRALMAFGVSHAVAEWEPLGYQITRRGSACQREKTELIHTEFNSRDRQRAGVFVFNEGRRRGAAGPGDPSL